MIENSFKADPNDKACFCVGPKNGEKLCPCALRRLETKDRDYNVMYRMYLGMEKRVEELEKERGLE